MPSPETPQPFDPKTQELVILVHGTFANNSKKSRDDHLKWWQAGGEVWNKIDEKLPEQFHVASDPHTEVFCWSGDNSERDRRAGGRKLFEHLQILEEKGVGYHLVGHSHGGSVIWHCLLESIKRRLEFHRKFRFRRKQIDRSVLLKGLRSFTTIGTPFLQLHTPMLQMHSDRLLGRWLGQKVDRLVDRTIGRMIGRLTPWFWMSGLVVSLTILCAMLDVYPTVVDFLATKNILDKEEWSKVPEILNTDSYRLLPAILDDNVAGPLVGLFLSLTAMLSMLMWAWASAVQLEASAVREGTRIRNQAFVKFGTRWLGIWSRHDEAINGLKASLNLGGRIAPRIELRSETVFDYDRRMNTYRQFARWFVAPVFNLIVARPGDGIIWRSVSRGIQGNDRPGCLVCDVSHGPIVPDKIEWEELPESYDKELLTQSEESLDKRSTELFRQLREMLSQLAWSRPDQSGVLMGNETSFEGNELVHTCYFHEPKILKVIACQIQYQSKLKGVRPDLKRSTARWCERFRRKTNDVSRDSGLKGDALPFLGKKNPQAIPGLLLSLSLLIAFFVCSSPSETPFADQYLKQYDLDKAQVTIYSIYAGLICSVIALEVTRSSIRRAKRGATWPRVARWGWRIARVAAVLYLVRVGLIAAEWPIV